MIDYWVTCPYATGMVSVEKEIIIIAPPIWRKFIGQRFDNLIKHFKYNKFDYDYRVLRKEQSWQEKQK